MINNNFLPKIVMFDMDGTILDSNYIWFDTRLDKIIFKNFNFDITNEILDDLMEKQDFILALQELIKKYNIKTSATKIIEMYEQYASDEYKQVKFKDNAFDYLKYLKNNKTKIVITTSCFRKCVDSFLKANKLENFFDWIITTKELGIDKDKPNIYLEVFKKFDIKSNESYAFEDSLTPIKTLKKLGVITYAVYDKWQIKKQNEIKNIADFYITNYAQLLKK